MYSLREDVQREWGMEGWVEEPEGELGACVGMHCSTVYISGEEGRTLGVSAGGSGHLGTGAEGQQLQGSRPNTGRSRLL